MNPLANALLRGLSDDFGCREPLDADSRLFSGGLLDSLSVVKLVGFFEEQTGLQVDPACITLDNFDTVNLMVRFARAQGDVRARQ